MDIKQYEISKARIKELCENVGKFSEDFILGAEFGALVGISAMARQITDLESQKVSEALTELEDVSALFNAAMYKESNQD